MSFPDVGTATILESSINLASVAFRLTPKFQFLSPIIVLRHGTRAFAPLWLH